MYVSIIDTLYKLHTREDYIFQAKFHWTFSKASLNFLIQQFHKFEIGQDQNQDMPWYPVNVVCLIVEG